jgi:hypothetical protein
MKISGESKEKRLDSAAAKLIRELLAEFRENLIAEASKTRGDGLVTGDDVYRAYQRFGFPTSESLAFADAQAVISRALRENRVFEWVSYGMAIILFVAGLLLLIVGAMAADLGNRVGYLSSGSIVELLILIPFRFAINSRRHNIALRMVGIVLTRVEDPEKLAPLLKDTFLSVVLGHVPSKVTRRD